MKGDYAYLMHTSGEGGSTSFIILRNGEFSIMPTSQDLPSEGPGGPIYWCSPVYADRERGCAYMYGTDSVRCASIAKIEYRESFTGKKAPLTLWRSEPLEDLPDDAVRAILPDGGLISVGGVTDSNYEPMQSVYVFYASDEIKENKAKPHFSIIIIVGLMFIAIAAFAIPKIRRRKNADTAGTAPFPSGTKSDSELTVKIRSLMEDQKYFKRKGLKVSDLASELGTNSKYISSCINKISGTTFTDYVNKLRVKYAESLLREKPEIKMQEAAEESGFSSEASFFRNFKLINGMSPAQWLSENKES